MEEERKWEELNIYLLVEIFKRVGIKSLSQCIPFVCKSWYHATLVPQCWETLVFPNFAYSNEFVKFVVDRSQGTATRIEFQTECPEQGLIYISEKCPSLKTLYLWHFHIFDDSSLVSVLIHKWKKLEFLHFSGSIWNLEEILESISMHCENFVGLSCSSYYLRESASSAIVELIPRIKYLKLSLIECPRRNLVKILKGCSELESLDVSYGRGFDDDDTEILELASHIPSYKCTPLPQSRPFGGIQLRGC